MKADGSVIPKDFVIALMLVLASNLLFCNTKQERPERALSYRLELGEIRRLDPDPPIDLVIHGDSRARRLHVNDLCDQLDPRPVRCVNLSSTAGDWVTAWGLQERVAPLLADDATIVLALSDYWLEMGGKNALGLIPSSWAYAGLGDPLSSFESYLPLSRARPGLVKGMHERIESLARRLRNAVGGATRHPVRAASAPERPQSPLPRANVDSSFRAARPEDLEENRSRADALLRAFRDGGRRVVIVYLPNPADREEYVDAVYPGRRQHFFASLRELADEHDVPLVDLSGRLPDRRDYVDFHHLNERGVEKATRLLAEALDEEP